MPPEHVCMVQPLGVSQNALLIVDIDVVNFKDLKADDMGSFMEGDRDKENAFQSFIIRRYQVFREKNNYKFISQLFTIDTLLL